MNRKTRKEMIISTVSLISSLLVVTVLVLALEYMLYDGFSGPNNNDTNTNSERIDASNLPKTNGAVVNIWLTSDERLDVLRENHIKYLFADIGDIDSNGNIRTSRDEIDFFLVKLSEYETKNNYKFITLPYTEVNTYSYNIESDAFRRNYINGHKELLELGFDGFYVDIEPVQFNQRESYLALLDSINDEVSSGFILSVYSGSFGDNGNEWEWPPEFYSKVSGKVDLIFVPGYDSGESSKEGYQDYIKYQIEQITNRNYGTQFILGIPTHKSSPENIGNALEAVAEQTSIKRPNNLVGVAVFAEWTSTKEDWEVFNSY